MWQARNRRKPLERRFPLRHTGEMRPFTFYKAAKHCRSITIPSVLRFDTSTRWRGHTNENRLLSRGGSHVSKPGLFYEFSGIKRNFIKGRNLIEHDRCSVVGSIHFPAKMFPIFLLNICIISRIYKMDDTIHYFSLVIDSNLFFITISIVAKLVQTREFWRIGGKESRIDARNEGGKTERFSWAISSCRR